MLLVEPVLEVPVADPLVWPAPVEVSGCVTDWLPVPGAELMPEFAGFAELFGFVEVSGCELVLVPVCPLIEPVPVVPVVLLVPAVPV